MFFKPRPDFPYNRLIQEFHGSAAVVGCSYFHAFCKTRQLFHDSQADFYTMDISPEQRPDFVYDITKPLPIEFKKRFELTIIECLAYDVYNHKKMSPSLADVEKNVAFDNIWDMTADDGFILFIGCPRLKEFREQMCLRQLKVIELDCNREAVLIGKNQNLNQDEIQKNIDKLPSALRSSINQAILWKAPNPFRTKCSVVDLPFCSEPYEEMQTIRERFNSVLQRGNS